MAAAREGAATCVGWRQTGGCTPEGPRESDADRRCGDEVPAGASGYCECAGGARAAPSDCQHEAFTCADMCAAAAAGAAGAGAGWKQTGGCVPSGPREDGADLACDAAVPAGASGYCQCADGRKAKESTCDHGSFKCGEACALLLGVV